MTLETGERDRLLAALRRIAGEEILPRFRNLRAGDVAEKTNRFDLVTEADLRTEARLGEVVAREMADVTVVGEEAVSADPGLLDRIGGAPRALIVDPVDGTWNFARGLPVFAVILALTEAGRTTWGMIYDPLGDSWVEAAAGQGAWVGDGEGARRPLRLDQRDEALSELNGFAHLFLFEGEERRRLFARLHVFGRALNLRCSAWEYRMLAEGHADFVLSPVLNPWDHAAGAFIATEAGGVARCLDGEDYAPTRRRGRLLVARSESVWATVAEALEGVSA